jgi:hypothetical protein
MFSIAPGKMMISLTGLNNGSRKKLFYHQKLEVQQTCGLKKKKDSFTCFNRHKVHFTFAVDLSNSQILKRGIYLAKL